MGKERNQKQLQGKMSQLEHQNQGGGDDGLGEGTGEGEGISNSPEKDGEAAELEDGGVADHEDRAAAVDQPEVDDVEI